MRASLPPRRPKKKPLRGNKPGLPRGSSLPPLKISYIVTLASVCYASPSLSFAKIKSAKLMLKSLSLADDSIEDNGGEAERFEEFFELDFS